MGGSAEAQLAGRERERALLDDVLRRTTAGSGALVLVTGEPGIGKTTLATAASAAAAVAGMTCLWGHCLDSPVAPPHLPFLQVLRELQRRLGDDAFSSLAPAELPIVLAAMPELAQPGGIAAPPAPEPHRLLDAITALVVAAGRRRPLLVVLDDLHWADGPTLRVLEWLAGELPRAPVAVLATYRGEDLAPDHALRRLEGAAAAHATHRLRLDGLPVSAVADLLGAAGVAAASPELAGEVHDRCGGNPLFTLETVRMIGADRFDVATLRASGDLPHGAGAVISARLARRSPVCRRVLAVAALAGDVALDLLESVTGLERREVLDALDEAVAAGLLVDDHGSRRFAHGLVRDAVRRELGGGERARLHGAIAGALERRPDRRRHLAALALHHAGAADGDPAHRQPAHDAACLAAAATEARLGWAEAARLLLLAAATTPEGDDGARAEHLLAAVHLHVRAGEVAAAAALVPELAAIARRLADRELLARAAVALRGLSGPGVNPVVLAVCSESTARPPEDEGLAVRVLGQLALTRMQEWAPAEQERGRAESAVALERALHLDDPDALFAALDARQFALCAPGEVEERLAVADRALALGIDTGRDEVLAWAHEWRCDALLLLGRTAECEASVAAAASIAERRHDPLALWRVQRGRAALAMLRGDFATSRRLVDEALDLGRRGGNPGAEYLHPFTRAALATVAGSDAATWEPVFRDKAERGEAAGLHAELLTVLGRLGEARNALRRAEMAGEFAGAVPRPVLLLASASLVTTVRALEDRRLAALLKATLQPHMHLTIAAGSGQSAAFGSVARLCGELAAVLGELDEAAVLLDRAIVDNEAMGAVPFAVVSRLGLAEVLLRRRAPGDLGRARELAAAAIPAVARFDLVAGPRAAALEARLGGGSSHRAQLSDRQLEVASLVAAGLSNREIAAHLHLTEKTAESHIRNICDRLGVSRRSQIAAWVSARQG